MIIIHSIDNNENNDNNNNDNSTGPPEALHNMRSHATTRALRRRAARPCGRGSEAGWNISLSLSIYLSFSL